MSFCKFFFFFNYSYHFCRRIKAAHFIKNENRLDKTCGKWSVILLTNRWLQKVFIQARGVFILIKQNIFWTKLMYRKYGMSRLRSTSMHRRLMLKLKAREKKEGGCFSVREALSLSILSPHLTLSWQHLISLYNITPESNVKVTRIR